MSAFLSKMSLTGSKDPSRARSGSMESTGQAVITMRYNPAEINAYPFPQDSLHAVLRLGIVVLKHGACVVVYVGVPRYVLTMCLVC
jgi:hypothetical protein